ncbi:MAG: AAA family ATPase [archaeon]|nr:AAA family ATPase [archaeon]
MDISVIKRFFNIPKQSFFLFGPRGTGKTTLMKLKCKNCLWIDFLNPKVERMYRAHPERLYDYIEANTQHNQIVIDEVQKVPKVLSVVHDIIESKNGKQFIKYRFWKYSRSGKGRCHCLAQFCTHETSEG